jgi:hypothetical protein
MDTRSFIDLLERVREVLRSIERQHHDTVQDLRLALDRAIEDLRCDSR